MKMILVGNRDGKAVANWSGVLASALWVTTLAVTGAAVTMFALNWFSPVALIMAALLGVLVIATGVQRAFQLPVDQLQPLKSRRSWNA